MKREKIFQKAIDKANQNGLCKDMLPVGCYAIECFHVRCWLDVGDELIDMRSIIFSHQFAKAFWGEERYTVKKVLIPEQIISRVNPLCTYLRKQHYANRRYTIKGWQYHLQQLVLEKDPVKYLEKFL